MWIATLLGHRKAARAAAALTAALFAAGPILITAPAHAAPDSSPTIEFGGGSTLNVLVCKSQPSKPTLIIPADSKVTFVNRLGQDATLRIDGQSVSKVAANKAVPVSFHYGPVEVAMTFECMAGVVEQFKPMSVQVTKPAATPAAGSGTGGGAAGSGGGATGGGAATGGRTAATKAPATGRSAAPTTSPDAALPVPGDPSVAAAPLTETSSAASDRNGTTETVADGYDVGDAVPAAGAVRNGVSSMLALLSVVFVIGLTIAALRVIAAQRTIRAQTV